MTGVDGQLTPLLAAQNISKGLANLDAAVKRYKAAEDKAAKARVKYKTEEARALLRQTDGSVPVKKAKAATEVETLFEESEVADTAVRVLREEVRFWYAYIDAWRSLGATSRAEFSTLHYGT